jgi:hypothetical protein
MTAKERTTKPATAKARHPRGRKWSQHVTETSDALDLEAGVFKGSPHPIATSLKRSADRSRRRKTDSFRSAMSMLTFYVNRAGKHLSIARRRILEAAKDELRAIYGRTGGGETTRRKSTRACDVQAVFLARRFANVRDGCICPNDRAIFLACRFANVRDRCIGPDDGAIFLACKFANVRDRCPCPNDRATCTRHRPSGLEDGTAHGAH